MHPSILYITNARAVVTMDPAVGVLENADVLVVGDTIRAVGRDLAKDPQLGELAWEAAEVVSGEDRVVLPGFVNTHHHLTQTLTRALPRVQDAKLFDWLVDLYDVWAELTPDGAYVAARVGLGELLLTGCTTAADHFYLFPQRFGDDIIDETVRAAAELGIRFHPTRGSMSRGRSHGGLPPDSCVQTEAAILKDYDRFVDRFHDPAPRSLCRVALAPCSPFSVTTELMRDTAIYARERGLRCHTHLAETLDEERFCLELHGLRPLAYMESVGWVGADIWFAHGVHFDPAEIALLGRTKTGIAHCPVSNLRLGSGIAHVPALRAAGVPVGLAVDGSASNDASNMLRELRTALLVHRVGTDVEAMPALDVFDMATRGGAAVLGRDDVGMLRPGMAADLAVFRVDELGYAGAGHDPVAALLFCGTTSRTDLTIVNGRVVVRDGRLVAVPDERELVRRANAIAAAMVDGASAKTGLDYRARVRRRPAAGPDSAR
jgi:cytosine/adenosine deaminase-related metal-dependent hydrolase